MATQTSTAKSPGSKIIWRVVVPMVLIVAGVWFIFRPSPAIEAPAAGSIEPAVAPAQDVPHAEALAVNLAPAPKIGHPAPDFNLHTLDGQPLSLSDFRGQPVIVNFWATWCGPCRLEMPHLQDSYAAHQDDGLVVLGVNLTKDDDPALVPGFVDAFGLTFPIALDSDGEMRQLYQLLGQPASVFIDRDGVIQEYWQGPINQQFIEERLEKIL